MQTGSASRRRAVSKWERGLSLPDATFLRSLCRILHCSADALLGTHNQEIPSECSPFASQEVMDQLRFSQDPLALIFGLDLTQAFLSDVGQNYCSLFNDCRLRLARLGILMPVVRLRDECGLAPNEFQILANHRILYRECLETPDDHVISHMTECLYQTVSEHYDAILNCDLVYQITENLRTDYPALISGVVPEILSYRLLCRLLKKLWKSGNCFLHLIPVIELAGDLVMRAPGITIDELADSILPELPFS